MNGWFSGLRGFTGRGNEFVILSLFWRFQKSNFKKRNFVEIGLCKGFGWRIIVNNTKDLRTKTVHPESKNSEQV